MECFICQEDLDEAEWVIPVRRMGAPNNQIFLCSYDCYGEYKAQQQKEG